MSLRGFRKKNQSSMLRYIRRPSQQSPKVNITTEQTLNNDTSCSILETEHPQPFIRNKLVDETLSSISFQHSAQNSSRNFINGCSSSSPNKLESTPPTSYLSKIFYVEPKVSGNEENRFIVDAKESGFDTSALLKDKSPTTQYKMTLEESPQIHSSNLINKKRRISSDNESEESSLAKRQCLENETISDCESQFTTTSKYTDEMVEKLLDTYMGLYPEIDRMEIYEVLERWDFNLTESCANMEAIQKVRKAKLKRTKLLQKMEDREKQKEEIRINRIKDRNKEKFLKSDEKSQNKMRKAVEMERKKKIWKMKAKFHEDEDSEEEDEYIGKSKVYVSESSDDEEPNDSEELVPARNMVLNLFNDGLITELTALPGCSKKKADIIMNVRPFENWNDLVFKFKTEKMINPELLNSAKDVLQMRGSVQKLMKRCEKISIDISNVVTGIIDGKLSDEISKQPSILNPKMTLKNYQLIGLNWLVLMHEQHLNGVLADEMGLGKTIQAIAFLAYLKEKGELEENHCLIVVPTSTMDNWARELELWCPTLGFLVYHGSQEERRGMRMEIVNNDLDEGIHILLTTYNMVVSSSEDRGLFKRIKFHTVIFDEAHMLKNMASQRYENLMKIRCKRRLLLTGTPLQNNLVELMSILVFVMPQLFEGRKDELRKVFAMFPKCEDSDYKGVYERERIQQAKRIMAPFFLRRLKQDVLKDLPKKTEEILKISMSVRQHKVYHETVEVLKKTALEKKDKLEDLKLKDFDEVAELEAIQCIHSKLPKKSGLVNEDSSSSMLMKLRKIANHPLLHRSLYTSEKMKKIAQILKKTSHQESVLDYIIEDLFYMSDFEIHQTCSMFEPIKKFCLKDEHILNSGKFKKLDEMLPKMKTNGDRVLIFSQFCLVLNIVEAYLKIRGHSYRRLDGSTNVAERQDLIDDFNENSEIFVFLLSTRAGGLGINLAAANIVILHDIDFNPYNDKQAEDRCHRLGQTRPVTIYRYICNNSIEEGMHQIGCNKLQLEKDVTGRHDDHRKKDVQFLLKTALGEAEIGCT